MLSAWWDEKSLIKKEKETLEIAFFVYVLFSFLHAIAFYYFRSPIT